MKSVWMLLMLTLGFTGFCQTENEMIMYIGTPPRFHGGEDSLWCFIERNLDFTVLNNSQHQGVVIVSFEIDTTGKVIHVRTNPESTQGREWLVNDRLIEDEIKRVFKRMPDWEPGLQKDKPIRVPYIMPIPIPYTKFKCESMGNRKDVLKPTVCKNV
ncbi:MAG: hypothetical protein JXR53_15765 [Bacteroidales bacterium]|nr:hypothetical protein [Bacteroidales bacterium]